MSDFAEASVFASSRDSSMTNGSPTSGLNGWLLPISAYREMRLCSSWAFTLKACDVRFRSRSIAMTSTGRIAISIAWRRWYLAVYGFVQDVTVLVVGRFVVHTPIVAPESDRPPSAPSYFDLKK